jgi:hypothetical protein
MAEHQRLLVASSGSSVKEEPHFLDDGTVEEVGHPREVFA